MRYSIVSALVMLSAAFAAAPAHAEVAGPWHVSGDVSGKPFALDCRFEPHGAQFGGVCIAAATGDDRVKPGKAYKLTQGVVNGNQVRWAYETSVLFMSIDVAYAGTLSGNRINGTITAAGRKGAFVAVRK